MKLGSKLNQLCKAQGLSLSRLAKEAGVPMQTLHAWWATGRKSINPDQIKKVASVLKISVHELLFDERDPHESVGVEILKEIFSGDVRIVLRRKKIIEGRNDENFDTSFSRLYFARR